MISTVTDKQVKKPMVLLTSEKITESDLSYETGTADPTPDDLGELATSLKVLKLVIYGDTTA